MVHFEADAHHHKVATADDATVRNLLSCLRALLITTLMTKHGDEHLSLALAMRRLKEADHLEHGATVLAMELAALSSLAETELRQGRDPAEALLAGEIGCDLGRPHRVVIVSVDAHKNDDGQKLFDGVRRSVRDLWVGTPRCAETRHPGVANPRSAAGERCHVRFHRRGGLE
jgi:hypothetical protein